MATSGSIADIQELLRSNINEQYNKLNYQWSKDIEESNNLISVIEQDPEYLEKNSLEILKTIERLNQEMDYYSELGINLEGIVDVPYDFPEIRRNLEKNYRTLSLMWYKYNFESADNQFQISKKSLDEILIKQQEINEKMSKTDNKIESLGATFLNIVLTISITSTMVTVLLNTSPQYSLAIILGSAWLLLSSIIFISSYFKANEKNGNNKLPFIIYIGLTAATMLAFGFAWFEGDAQNHPKKEENVEKVEIIEKDDALNQDNSSQKSQ